MNSIVERLRAIDSQYKPCRLEAADLIEQQAERIKELEVHITELEAMHQSALLRVGIRDQQLAALRKKIEDAPVVQTSKRQLLSGVQEISLIVREDLK